MAEASTAPTGDLTNRVLGWGSLAIAGIALLELVGTMTVGLAVNVRRMNFPIRQGYAFLTHLEKSPVGLALIVAAVFGAIAVFRRRGGESPTAQRVALWLVVAASAILAIATILSVMARFRVAELVTTQPVDSLTRRVLVVFVIRNFASAVAAALIAFAALSAIRSATAETEVVETEVVETGPAGVDAEAD